MAELVAKRYAEALFSLCKEDNSLDAIHEEFSAIASVISKEKELEEFMLSPQFKRDEKKEMLDNIFGGKISETLLNLFKLLVDKARFGEATEIFNCFHERYYMEKGIVSTIVYSVVPMKAEAMATLKSNLEKQIQKQIVIENKIDETLVGGIMLRIGDKVIDGSIKRRMELLKDDLLGHRV